MRGRRGSWGARGPGPQVTRGFLSCPFSWVAGGAAPALPFLVSSPSASLLLPLPEAGRRALLVQRPSCGTSEAARVSSTFFLILRTSVPRAPLASPPPDLASGLPRVSGRRLLQAAHPRALWRSLEHVLYPGEVVTLGVGVTVAVGASPMSGGAWETAGLPGRVPGLFCTGRPEHRWPFCPSAQPGWVAHLVSWVPSMSRPCSPPRTFS